MPLDIQPFLHRFIKQPNHKATAEPPVKNSLIAPGDTDLPRAGYGSTSTVEPGRKDSGSFTFNLRDDEPHLSHNHFKPPRRGSLWDSITELAGSRKSSRSNSVVASRSNSVVAIPPREDWEPSADTDPPKDQPLEKDKMTAITQKYGDIIQVTGLGDYAVILQAHKVQYCPPLDNYYGLKVFRRRPEESRDNYKKRVTSEFAIVSDLHHQNIIRTFELLPIGGGNLCESMEYCAGGDLHSLITAARKLPEEEANCLLKQLFRGVNYLHEQGVAHRDLKPENLLLTQRGCLKISDFGHAERFRGPDDDKNHVQLTTGRRNSKPYLSPEQYLDGEFDPRCVDVWAAAIVYVAMRTGRNMWKEATEDDEGFKQFKETGKNSLLDEIYNVCYSEIYSIVNTDPFSRAEAAELSCAC